MPASILRLFIALCLLANAPLVPAESGRSLSFFHTHTGETLTVRYWSNGAYDPAALEEINAFLGDWRDGTRVDMDPELLDALYAIREATGSNGTFEVISAYRSPQTNEMLRSRSNGVASKSQHLLGKAIDVRLRGVDTTRLRDVALALGLGGVGYYGTSDFIHVDTGRVRRW
jgi:uncharacterized protein YcbK (DUF882 family)